MKKNLAFVPILALCLLAVLQCGDDDKTTNTPSGPISFLRADHHACVNGGDGKAADSSACAYLKDSSWDGSQLKLTIHFTGNCCADFVDDVTVTDRLVEISLVDTAEPCRCICPYEDDFVFACPAPGDLRVKFQLTDEACAFDTTITVRR